MIVFLRLSYTIAASQRPPGLFTVFICFQLLPSHSHVSSNAVLSKPVAPPYITVLPCSLSYAIAWHIRAAGVEEFVTFFQPLITSHSHVSFIFFVSSLPVAIMPPNNTS